MKEHEQRLKRLERDIRLGKERAPKEIGPAAATPSELAEVVSRGRFRRTRLWALFDRIAMELLKGRILNALIMCPPQVGKSQFWSWAFPAWWLTRLPETRIVLASHGAQYAASWGRKVRDLVSRNGSLVGLDVRDDVSGASEWQLSEHEGGMVTAGVGGGIAGRPAELTIADDIVPDAQAASSRVERERIWSWWEEELSSRLQNQGRRVMVMTRRAVDDPPGRILELLKNGKESWTVVKLPAICEEPEDWPQWGWKREPGEALVPELHPLDELEGVRLARGPHVWAGLYQQRPYPRGGGDIKSEWFKIVSAHPISNLRCRAWDLAYSESPTAKRTAGILMGIRRDSASNRYHIENAVFGRWGPGVRNQKIVQQAILDGRGVPVILEEEPGSGGPAQVDELTRLLDGFKVVRSRAARAGSKQLRADAMAAQAQVGNFTIYEAPWNGEFLAEVDSFPDGPTIDMVDAAAHAYNFLAGDGGPVVMPSASSLAGKPIFNPKNGWRIFA